MTIVLSFIVGLEFHHYLRINTYPNRFGSTRTLVLIGILGFILYQIDSSSRLLITGMGVLSLFLGIYYWRETAEKRFSLFEIFVALLVFLIGPISLYFPNWFLVLFVVLLILILNERPLIHQFSENLTNTEIVTLAKFLLICGVILPLLPDTQILPDLPITFYKAWISVIVVSGFSYLSYLAQTYFFKSRGLLLSGLLGGLYSSTAISVVIGRRAQKMPTDRSMVSAALIMATAMMYLRLLLIMFFLDIRTGKDLLLPFTTLIILSCIATLGLLHYRKPTTPPQEVNTNQHPLELATAIIFAFMFVFFAFITQYVISHFGQQGLHFLSIVAGFTDIDPFILSLLSGKYAASETEVVSAVLIATGSNNLLKAVYIAVLARNQSIRYACAWLITLFMITTCYAFYFV
ncbi:DUF4010 domain-containing protein [Methylomonas sp. AM2-LC]|uniref:MgtC/SapB family protein n=1 Tax=Methylomonas sp. AM2-LC TaxID=3153301 RepID=UPI003262E19A